MSCHKYRTHDRDGSSSVLAGFAVAIMDSGLPAATEHGYRDGRNAPGEITRTEPGGRGWPGRWPEGPAGGAGRGAAGGAGRGTGRRDPREDPAGGAGRGAGRRDRGEGPGDRPEGAGRRDPREG